MSLQKGFKLITSSKVFDKICVNKYESLKTGLKVILADVDGPVVSGAIGLVTEANDDDGLPHTLEHLIFMGSQLYPFKGILDLLANRCLASGTNAWTDTDNTFYTVTTAGKQGFLTLLPIYLDHILFPTLKDSAYLTEVHHINGKGEDCGVVYCEMQIRENTGESLADLEMKRKLFSNTGYAAETGGILHNLRTSTTNEKVRAYHRKFYHSDNLAIIICGKDIQIEEVAMVLEPFEQNICNKMQRSTDFKRPFHSMTIKPMTEIQNIEIKYPSDEEDCGIITIGWHGPKCINDYFSFTAMSVLLNYLCYTSVSPLQREFIEINNPICSDIACGMSEQYTSCIYLVFENVQINKMSIVFDKLMDILRNISNKSVPIDMVRIQTIIEKKIVEMLNSLENGPHDVLISYISGDFLYGDKIEHLNMRLNVQQIMEELKLKDGQYWIDLIKKYFVDGIPVFVRGLPSIAEQKRLQTIEELRIEKQRTDLGEIGLCEKGTELKRAIAENSILPPAEILDAIPLPKNDTFNYHKITVYRNNGNNFNVPIIDDGNNDVNKKILTPIGFDINQLPNYVEAYDLNTNFVYITVTFNTNQLKTEQRLYLTLWLELIQTSPIEYDGIRLTYEEVVTALEKDTIAIGTELGFGMSSSSFLCGQFSQTAILTIQVERKKYTLGVEWILKLLFGTVFTLPRIRICLKKIINSIAQAKRNGDGIVGNLSHSLYLKSDCNMQANSMIEQLKFLKKLRKEMTANSIEKLPQIIGELNGIRENLTRCENMALHIAADWNKLHEMNIDVLKPWLGRLTMGTTSDIIPKRCLNVTPEWQLWSEVVQKKVGQGEIIALGCIESGFLCHTVPSIRAFNDPDLPALLLCLEYLTQLEGVLWRNIRGKGLAYGYNIIPKPNTGLLYLTLYGATEIVECFKIVQDCMNDVIADRSDKWESNILSSARNSLIFQIVDREKSIGELIHQGILASFKLVDMDYNRWLVKSIIEVTTLDLDRIAVKYLKPLISDEAKTAIICSHQKAESIKNGFMQQFNRNLLITNFKTCALNNNDVSDVVSSSDEEDDDQEEDDKDENSKECH